MATSTSPASSASSSILRIPTAEVYERLLAPSRYKGAYGGRGSGKSHFFAELLVERAVSQPGFRGVCIREVQKSLQQSVKRLVEDKIKSLGIGGFRILKTEIETPSDGLIIFQGMQNHTADSIKSLEGYDVAWVEEAQNVSNRSLGLLRPTIRKTGSEMWFSWNPNVPNNPVEFLRSDPPPGALIVEANYRDNPWFPDELRREMEYDKRRDPERYAHVWLGGYQRNSEARVFRNWKVDELEVPADARPYYGADWGFSVDPTVLVRCYFLEGRTLYIDAEAYAVGCEIDRTADLFRTIGDVEKWPITADSARPETISYMQKRGWNITPARKGIGSLEEGIEFLKAHDIVVHSDCKHVIDELSLYSFKKDKLTDEILPVLEDRHNHTIDAVRYAVENVRRRTSVYGSAETTIGEGAKKIPGLWQRVAGVVVDSRRFVAVWGAYDRITDTIHIYDVHAVPRAQLPVHADAMRLRGNWIPAVMGEAEKAAERDEAQRVAVRLAELGVDLMMAPFDLRGAVEVVAGRLASGRLRVFDNLDDWFREYRSFGRDDKGEVVEEGQEIMRATALIVALGLSVAITENRAESDRLGFDEAAYDDTRNKSTGY